MSSQGRIITTGFYSSSQTVLLNMLWPQILGQFWWFLVSGESVSFSCGTVLKKDQDPALYCELELFSLQIKKFKFRKFCCLIFFHWPDLMSWIFLYYIIWKEDEIKYPWFWLVLHIIISSYHDGSEFLWIRQIWIRIIGFWGFVDYGTWPCDQFLLFQRV